MQTRQQHPPATANSHAACMFAPKLRLFTHLRHPQKFRRCAPFLPAFSRPAEDFHRFSRHRRPISTVSRAFSVIFALKSTGILPAHAGQPHVHGISRQSNTAKPLSYLAFSVPCPARRKTRDPTTGSLSIGDRDDDRICISTRRRRLLRRHATIDRYILRRSGACSRNALPA